jgi:hypothetical protein
VGIPTEQRTEAHRRLWPSRALARTSASSRSGCAGWSMPTPSIIDRRWGATSDAGCGVVAFVEPPEQRVGGAAVLRTVVDSDVVVDVASELPELVLGDTARGMPPLRHGEHAGEIDGLGVGHDRCDRVTGREPAGQRVVAEKRVDQRSAPVSVEAVPGPEGGDVGRLGERVGGCLAAVASGQPVVALCSVTTTRRQLVSGTYSSSMCRPRRNSVSRTLRMCVSSSRSVRLNAVSLLRRVPPRSSRGRRGSPGPRMRQRPRCRAAPEHRRRRRRR